MTRPKYLITLNGERVATKQAWNSAMREVERLAKQEGTKAGESYMRRVSAQSSYVPEEYKLHEEGTYVWQGDKGTTCTFHIRIINLAQVLA
jgi:hypothetical protein